MTEIKLTTQKGGGKTFFSLETNRRNKRQQRLLHVFVPGDTFSGGLFIDHTQSPSSPSCSPAKHKDNNMLGFDGTEFGYTSLKSRKGFVISNMPTGMGTDGGSTHYLSADS